MTEETEARKQTHRRLWLALVIAAAILAVLIVPPLVSISRYKNQITHLISASLGRPVRLSSVNLRLLPRPGFELTDLTVDEDPIYGAEPILHANSVTASFRLLSLWRGRLEIGRISVDEASLNLVHNANRWNVDSLFTTAATQTGAIAANAGRRSAVPLPYLSATNSRINIKNGAEKLPFSLVNTDLSFSQEKSGDWRISLRGQPARTDLSLELEDTGVVRLEANVHRAPELRQMPVRLDLDWRQAQLGQLMRLVIGSDPGWRGDLTGELHLEGTADSAQVKTRLRATGIHRAEFAPAASVDFDGNCTFVYHYSSRALDDLACDSPLGDGRIHLDGDLPAEGGSPHFSVALDRVPATVGLDALRTVRSNFGPGLKAAGAISGKMSYSQTPAANLVSSSAQKKGVASPRDQRSAKANSAPPGPLTGSFIVDGLQLSGDALSTPISFPKMVLGPVAPAPGQAFALAASVAIPAGGAAPLTVTSRLSLIGYQVTAHGQASLLRAKEMALVAGLPNADLLNSLAGEPIAVDLIAQGPWLAPPTVTPNANPSTGAQVSALPGSTKASQTPEPTHPDATAPDTDTLSGTVTLHNANWKADYLASHVIISTATLHLGNGETRLDPVVFTYGPVAGTATLSLPAHCDTPEPCPPQFEIHFGDLDAGTLQAAVLGARERGTMLSSLIARLRLSSAPAWPRLQGTVKANSLILGPVTLREPSATVRMSPAGAQIDAVDAALLGGHLHGSGTLTIADKPAYTLQGHFEKLNSQDICPLLGLRSSGGRFDADGKIELSGYTGNDLAASAKGTLNFEWLHGAIGPQPSVSAKAQPVPAALARFDRWTGAAEIANGAITLKQNQVQRGVRQQAVDARMTLSEPPKLFFASPKPTQAKAH